jgi:DNA primase
MGAPERAVRLELERMRSAPAGPASGPPSRAPRARTSPDEEVEWEALKLLVQEPELCLPWREDLDPSRFEKPMHRKAFELIAEVGRDSGPALPAGGLVAWAQERGEQVARLIAALAVETPKSEREPTRAYAEQVFLRLEEFSLKRRADVIRRELERVNPLKAPDEHERMFEQLVLLEGERRRLRVAAEGVKPQ